MKTQAQRAAKRAVRARRPIDRSTWKCPCGDRHPIKERCPIPRRREVAPFADPFGGLGLAVLGALAAAERGRK